MLATATVGQPWAAEPAIMPDDLPERDVHALFAAAEAAGRVGIARKTRAVDARPARPGEVVITVIKDEGRETRSRPAVAGDMVVRNRCPVTGDEAYLVSAGTFAERYRGPFSDAEPPGWREYRPSGPELRYMVVTADEQEFRFTAPWGESMRARPGDVIVRNPARPEDTYRVAAASFACTYEVVAPPGRG